MLNLPALSKNLLRPGGRQALKRGGWTVADQVLSSLTNFAVSVAAARSLSAADFGAFAIVFAGYLLALGLSRAIATDALGVRYSSVPEAEWREATTRALASALSVSLAFVTIAFGIGALTSGSLRAGFWALAAFIPGLLLQDFWRFAFFAGGKPARSAANDLVWAGALALGFLAMATYNLSDLSWFVGTWGAAATLAAGVGVVQAGIVPGLRDGFRWVRENRMLIPSFAGDFAVMNGVSQAIVFVVGAVAGLPGAGALRGATVIFGPLNVVIMSAVAVAVPEGARLRARRPELLVRVMIAMSLTVASSALLWGLTAWLLLPNAVGVALLGETWSSTAFVLPAMMVLLMASGAGVGAVTGLRIVERPDLSLRVRVIVAPIMLLSALVGGTLDGVRGALLATTIPLAIAAASWWSTFVTIARRDAVRANPGLN